MQEIKDFLVKALAWLKVNFKWWIVAIVILLGFAIIPNKDFKMVYSFLAGVSFLALVWLVEVKWIKK